MLAKQLESYCSADFAALYSTFVDLQHKESVFLLIFSSHCSWSLVVLQIPSEEAFSLALAKLLTFLRGYFTDFGPSKFLIQRGFCKIL